MSFRKWCISKSDKQLSRTIADKFGINGFTAHLLCSRGFRSDDEISEMLGFDDGELSLIDPFEIKDMDKAVDRVRKAIESFEKIAVYGDYDVDGVTSVSILYSYLELNDANVTYYIPSRRTEGYGLNKNAIDKLHEQEISLIITVDNGISAIDEVAYANSLGIDVVITDHHCEGESLPDAVAVVNPHRHDSACPFREYAGVGVAFKLLCALEGDANTIIDNYMDLVAMGTVADVVSLTGENRKLVRLGLEALQNSERIGLKALMEMAGLSNKPITSSSISFVIAPRINAAGRLGNAERAVRLLISDDEDEAVDIASQLTAENRQRQALERDISDDVNEMLENNPELLYDRVLVLAGQNWDCGVTGIFASRMCERYDRPCIVISCDGDSAKGSGRSIEGFSLYEAISSCSSLLTTFGGHTLAAGLTLRTDDIDKFRKAINTYAGNAFPQMPAPVLHIDCQLPPSMIDMELYDAAELLEPFGEDNQTPVIALIGLKIIDIFGAAGGKHQRLTLERNKKAITAMRFSVASEDFPFKTGDIVDIAVTLDKTIFRNVENLSIVIRDIRLSETKFDEIHSGNQLYERFMRQEGVSDAEITDLKPTRSDVSLVYRNISEGYSGSADVLGCRMKRLGISYGKLLVIIRILQESGLINFKNEGSLVRLTAIHMPSGQKMDLEASPTAKRLGYSNT